MDCTALFLPIFLLLLRSFTLTSADGAASISVQSPACSDELVTFSSCLPYVAVSPNNLTDSPPTQCCDAVSAAFLNGSEICLCFFFRRPNMLGFPLNASKLVSLTSVCPLKGRNSRTKFSLEAICSGLNPASA